tara:strand:+ start:1799 stop:1999 length:201 start_codon:yes stop_codon:yes gene_type:complete
LGFAFHFVEPDVRLFVDPYEKSFLSSPMHLTHIMKHYRHIFIMRLTHDCLMTNNMLDLLHFSHAIQ